MQEERRGRVDCPQLGTSQCTSVNCFCGREPPAYKVLVKRLYLADQMVQFVWHRHLGISAEFCIRTTVLIIQCLAVLILFVCSDQPLSYSWRSCSRIVCAFMQPSSCSWFSILSAPWIFPWAALLLLRGSEMLWKTNQECVSLGCWKPLSQANPFIRIYIFLRLLLQWK